MTKVFNHKSAKVALIVSLSLTVFIFIFYWVILAGRVQNYTATNRIKPDLLLTILGALGASLGLAYTSYFSGIIGAFATQKYEKTKTISFFKLFKDRSFWVWYAVWVIVWVLLTLIWRGQAW